MILLENVGNMDPLGAESGPSAAGQSVCFLVSLGYQVRLAFVRASDYDGPTIRQRLFSLATAPGIPLPQIPPPTHGVEDDQYAYVSASAATINLGPIHNDRTFINPICSDHVPFQCLQPIEYSVVSKIPAIASDRPNNLSSAWSKLTSEEKNWFKKHTSEQQGTKGASWCRINPNKPMTTILTAMIPKCVRGGPTLHWLHHRVVSLMKLRRFHGVPDDYTLVGGRKQQLHQIGNSVAWASASMLGTAYAEA